MRSPLVIDQSLYKYRNVIRTLIPRNINNLIFPSARDLEPELYFSKKYNVFCSTFDYRIYDFWKAYYKDPETVFYFARKLLRKIELANYTELSRIYYKQADENVRAALFLIMNRCGHQKDFFKDSFSVERSTKVENFLQQHSHFIPPNLHVEYDNLIHRLGIKQTFTILDLSTLSYENKINVVEDTSFARLTLIEALRANDNWCLATNTDSISATMKSSFAFYYLDNHGSRSLSETNKILFFKTN